MRTLKSCYENDKAARRRPVAPRAFAITNGARGESCSHYKHSSMNVPAAPAMHVISRRKSGLNRALNATQGRVNSQQCRQLPETSPLAPLSTTVEMRYEPATAACHKVYGTRTSVVPGGKSRVLRLTKTAFSALADAQMTASGRRIRCSRRM